MLEVVADAFQRARCQVIGTSTSGQASRTLGDEAGMDESRTIASLIWRLDHDRLSLDSRTVVVLDEGGMTNDLDMVRLVNRIERAGAKLVVVGDDRQLGPVGPGGAMGALVDRHPEMLHVLDQNHRQHDPHERAALEELRARNVGVAADWYDQHGRVHCQPDSDTTRRYAVEAWAADMAEGKNTALFAHQRANVAELNGLARETMLDQGRVFGPEVHGFAVGDRVVATQPIPGVKMVNSERATVIAVNPAWGLIDLQGDDGRLLPGIQGDELDRLDYGYATTVHRSQGATVETAHVLADGGGRELAYVAMSRARETTEVYVVADDLEMALEDLKVEWKSERRPRWAIDTGLPSTTEARDRQQELDQAQIANVLAIARHERTGPGEERQRAAIDAQLAAYRTQLDGVGPPAPTSAQEWDYPSQGRRIDI
jgi:ATP-dependent exoDNAse (exonuclease V) alpha subunit